jgi:hypothetical protein
MHSTTIKSTEGLLTLPDRPESLDSHEKSPCTPFQRTIKEETSEALEQLNSILKRTNDFCTQQMGEIVQADDRRTEEVAENLWIGLQSLYSDVVLSKKENRLGTSACEKICDYLVKQARRLYPPEGFSYWINCTRNGFASHWHGHRFPGLLLYAGRTAGTDISTLSNNDAGITPIQGRFTTTTFNFLNTPSRGIARSDTSKLLVLPEGVAHRSSGLPRQREGGAQLMIVLFPVKK